MRYVTTSFWTDLDDVNKDDPPPVKHSTTAADSVSSMRPTEPSRYQTFVFAFYSSTVDLRQLHPTEGRTFTLWQWFVERVDPVLKLIHIPTIQRQILQASQDLANIPPAFESLMFSIYHAAVTSIQCSVSYQTLLQEERQTLLDRYRFGVEQALAKANFMSSPNVPTLQALTLYLICARQSADKTYIWSLTGLLIRLAMKLGLHRDPVALGLPPFHAEMRRRLWWQILILDVRTAEDNDMDPVICEHAFDTKYPANVNDVDLDVNMTEPVRGSDRRTEMLFTLTRFEVSYGARKLVFSPKFTVDNGYPSLSVQEKIDMADSLLGKIEGKYLRNCDTRIPICFLAATANRIVLAKIKLTISHPTRSGSSKISQERHQSLVENSIEIIEYARTLRADDKYSRWVWLFQTYIEWDAVAFLLHSINAVPLPTLLERAWKAIDTFFRDWKGHVLDTDRRWRRLESLRAKAATKQGLHGLPSNADEAQLTTRSWEQDANTTVSFIPLNSGNVANLGDCSTQPDGEHQSHSALSTASRSHLAGEATGAEYVDWNFDNVPYIMQSASTWEMDLDENAFSSWI
ncbi:uncharacterized protein A1O5_10591 [Cladophialophora psammophila CBS 110553]|uniref:Xylanolytic transcriptional activator regulatory domain-containing protein n=1 Tax=Cladophialophora psammophila CBS 110553 TaxID=1182543 RepID=W9X7L8_9EURO|nr:uncharacterized protein A1O5_10591 [Cladophialophora psammophila CBS 110553]EXJ66439.1 hypothetical protein A1O5_10591 [Cladophialophora psammophila CBS 110553]